MARQTLSKKAKEGGTFVVRLTWLDEDDNAVTPDSATWSLTNSDGVIINSREDVAIAVPSTYNDVVLGPDDLLCSSHQDEDRVVIGKFIYDSAAGSNLTGVDEVAFGIEKVETVVGR